MKMNLVWKMEVLHQGHLYWGDSAPLLKEKEKGKCQNDHMDKPQKNKE